VDGLEDRRDEREQLNTPAAEQEPAYNLEDIIREFGGWSTREPEKMPASAETPEETPAPAEMPATAAEDAGLSPAPGAPGETERPEAEEPEEKCAAPESEQPPEAAQPEEETRTPPKPVSPSGRFHFVRFEPGAASPDGPAHPEQTRRIRREPNAQRPPRPARTRPDRPAREPKPAPATREPTPEEAYRAACKSGGILARRRMTGFLLLLSLLVTFGNFFGLRLGSVGLSAPLSAKVLLCLLLAGTLLSYDVCLDGVFQLLRLHCGLNSLAAVSAVVFAADGFLSAGKGKIPYTAVLLLELYFALWSRTLRHKAERRTLKAVLAMGEEPSAAVLSRRAWNGNDCIFRAERADVSIVHELREPDLAEKAMRYYAALVFALSLVIAMVCHFGRGRGFLGSWAAILAGSVPAAAFVCYARPFAAAAGNLLRAGAALCGWQGAKRLGGKACLTLTDSDLFPHSCISMNGMKIFGDRNVSEVVGYTCAVIAASGCGLEPTFREIAVSQNGRNCTLDTFRRYEGGGIGGEIQGDVVLVGSIGFMQLMGVRMPEGTNVRQAVYTAVNGTLAAVFAIQYHPSAAVRSGLQAVLRCRGLKPLMATRDFILTPAVVRHKYKVPADCLEFPTAEERARLSDPAAPADGEPGALLSRESFLPMAEAVASARRVCASARTCLMICLLSGSIGFVITVILAFLGAFAAASAFNLTLFNLLWIASALLLSSVAGK